VTMYSRLERLERVFSEPGVPIDETPLTEEQRSERITLLLARCDSDQATHEEQQRVATIRYVLNRATDRQQREHGSAPARVYQLACCPCGAQLCVDSTATSSKEKPPHARSPPDQI
jgi:hypothetical protein